MHKIKVMLLENDSYWFGKIANILYLDKDNELLEINISTELNRASIDQYAIDIIVIDLEFNTSNYDGLELIRQIAGYESYKVIVLLACLCIRCFFSKLFR